MEKVLISRGFVKHVLQLTKSYWQSEEKNKAFGLLGAIIALTLAYVYVLVLLNHWNNAFFFEHVVKKNSTLLFPFGVHLHITSSI